MSPSTILRRLVLGIALAAGLAVHGEVRAEETSMAGERPSKEWERLLRERDDLILDLRRRVEALEQQRTASAMEPAQGSQSPPTQKGFPATRGESSVPPSSAGPPSEDGAAPRKAAGQFDVDEDAAERALERTLVATGALLLPIGQIDLQPSFTYSRREDEAPVVLSVPGGQTVATHRIRRDLFSSDLFMRVGLPHDTQLEVGLPYRFARQQEINAAAFSPYDETRSTASGLGDLNIGLAKGLLRERNGLPDVVARIGWDTALGGSEDETIPLGNGFNEVLASLTLTKRQDPLVFVGSASYGFTVKKDDVKPGDQFGLSLGVLLAASPETSLRVALNQTFVGKLKIGDRAIDGTDRLSASLSFGASSIVGHGKFLDLTAGVGLTEDAPAFSVGVSFSVRVGAWGRRLEPNP